MNKRILLFIALVNYCINSLCMDQSNLFDFGNAKVEAQSINTSTELEYYSISKSVPATDQMPALVFELKGERKEDGYYYPKELVIQSHNRVLQELKFDEERFAPCTMKDFGWEYGDYRFDGYGGFRVLSTSLGKNPSYYYWLYDKEKDCFVENIELGEVVGYTTFDDNRKLIYVSGTGGNSHHEYDTYQYIDGKIVLIEKVVDTEK